MTVTCTDISDAARGLGLSGRPLCLHSSLRSFGRVDGGARAVLDGLLDEGCTVLVPTFTEWFATRAPLDRRLQRNAYDYDRDAPDWSVTDRMYDPESPQCAEGLGALPGVVAALPGRARGGHPLLSFSAFGPLALEMVSGEGPQMPFASLEQLVERRGSVVLMGVDLVSMTLIHLAEVHAGRELFRRWAINLGGNPIECLSGGCSEGFGRLDDALSTAERTVKVGESLWRVFDARLALELAARAIRDDPAITHCADEGCERCNDAVAGGPIV